jgi:hypothetical protein
MTWLTVTGQTKQRPKENGQENKQRSTKHYTTQKIKDRATWIPCTKNRRWNQVLRKGRSSYSTSDTRRVTLVTNLLLITCLVSLNWLPYFVYKILQRHARCPPTSFIFVFPRYYFWPIFLLLSNNCRWASAESSLRNISVVKIFRNG